jgi:Do/DeqQ family serine protease
MLRRILVTTIFLLAGVAAGLVLTGRMRTADESRASTSAVQPEVPDAQPLRVTGPPDLTAVAERAIASVTNISSTQIVRTPNSPFANDPFFRRFFGQDDLFGYRERRAQSLGSGVVVSKDGYVMTNTHVIGNSRAEVTVTLPDKRELRARIIGADDMTDIAILKIDAGNLPTMPWGDSSKLKVAEWVLAIGNPYQLSQSVTLGIVSATGRSVGLATYEDFIQTDAAINPGNSGGALISARGELVGINTAIFSESGGYQGIGFAVPSNLARRVMDDLIAHGSVRRGTISGIWLQGLTTQVAEQLGAPNTRGVLVVRIDRRSDAFDAGLRGGDIIVKFNGTPVEDESHFVRLLSDAKIGASAALGVQRDGRETTIRVPVVQATGRPPR